MTDLAKSLLGLEIEDKEEFERKLNTCIARIRDASILKGRPTNTTELNVMPLELPCPLANEIVGDGGSGRCPRGDYHWECDDCGQLIYYIMPKDKSPIKLFFCDCGSGPIGELKFRCKAHSSRGPDEFVQFESNKLAAHLLRFQKFKEKNLLILGQTGVGKSTWINALANQITFQTMEDALQAEKPICLIPAQFSLTNDQFESVPIKICQHGVHSELDCVDCTNPIEDINENFSGADSSTKYPMGHIFTGIKGGRLRIIDTPGIGDTKGIEQDKENVNNIISYISTLEQIDCICILLKPNEARLDTIFRYCLQELLASLHRNAAKNIVFCFTNSRGTLYRPGDTLTPLKIQLEELSQKTETRIELKKENVFCVDNEAFRFLCAFKANFKFTEEDHKNFSVSWNHSHQEFDRLLNYMNDCLEPHCTKETTSLNEARHIILTLTKPLAIITKTIQTNIVSIQNEEGRLKELDTEASDFEAQLKIKRIYCEPEELKKPRTVCTSKSCTEARQNKDGLPEIIHKICHDECTLREIPRNEPGNPEIFKCNAINQSNGMCRKCGCDWRMHMHIYYLVVTKSDYVEDKNVRRMLDENANKKAIKQKAIEEVKKKVKQFEEEQKFINYVAAQAGIYLKKNSIVAINDGVEQYLKVQINEVEREDELLKDNRRLDLLKNSLEAYRKEREILENSFTAGQENAQQQHEEMTPDGIKKLMEELINLPLSGEQIKNFMNAEKRGLNSQRQYTETVFNRNAPSRASKNSSYNQRIAPTSSLSGHGSHSPHGSTISDNKEKDWWQIAKSVPVIGRLFGGSTPSPAGANSNRDLGAGKGSAPTKGNKKKK